MAAHNAPHDDILDSIGEGLFTVDHEFRIQYFNSSAERITGIRREDAVGRFCKNVFKSDHCQLDCPIATVLESGSSLFEMKTTIIGSGQSKIPITLNAAVMRDRENNPIGGVVSFRNLPYGGGVGIGARTGSGFFGLIGQSRAMKDVFELIGEIASTDANVLIQGETGTGKELAANAIQATSRRRTEKFIKVNCSVLPPQLLASELFGHTKGAFTDAVKDRMGRFEVADKGTVFLDEVAEMPLSMQPQLLRILQEGTFERVGESLTRRADVRIIAATNVRIDEAIRRGSFREDLFYRLNVMPIILPALRDRAEDIPLLLRHFIEKFNLIYDKHVEGAEDGALEALSRYAWPGNIRELENAIEYAFIRSRHETILTLCSLPASVRRNIPCGMMPAALSTRIDTEKLMQLLDAHKWNKSKVAKIIGVDRTTIWRHLKLMGIDNKM